MMIIPFLYVFIFLNENFKFDYKILNLVSVLYFPRITMKLGSKRALKATFST